MLDTRQWILPHLGGEVYADKPPLLFWSIALIASLGSGVTEWTARLPTALAAVAVCLVTWWTGVRLFSSSAGLMAALVLATSGGFFWSGRQALPDMLLTLWTTCAFYALWEWFSAQRPQAALIAGICMGLATLTKGPVGLILPALSGLMYLAVQRQLPKSWSQNALICLTAFLGVTLSWFVPAAALGGLEYVQTTLLHHNLERYVRAWEHKAPWYFYLGAFPAEFLPWTLFLPQALLAGARLHQNHKQAGWGFACCWLVTILGFFSISTGKRDIYILPAFPAAALLVGWVWSLWWQRPHNGVSRWAIGLPTLMLALTLCGLAAVIWGTFDVSLPRKSFLLLPATREVGMWLSLLLLVGGTILGSAVLAQQTRLIYAALVGCTWLAMLMTTVWVYTPQFNQHYPIKAFSAAVHTHLASDSTLQLCGPMNDLAVRFNLGRFVPALHQIPEVIRYLTGEEEVYCVIEAEWYQRLGEQTGQWYPIMARQEFEASTLLLISNQ
jgi:4-amino-4-deoxy-L-arabinose transferase-like glycosyltransferase